MRNKTLIGFLLGIVAVLCMALGEPTTFTDVTVTDDLIVADDATVSGDLVVSGAQTLTGNLTVTGALLGDRSIVAADEATETLTTAQSGCVVTNRATSGTIALPAVAAGLTYTVVISTATTTYIDPNGSNQIIALTNATGDRLSNGTAGNSITLFSNGTAWYSLGHYGTWSDAN